MTTIMPSHKCFDDCIDALDDALQETGPDWVREHLRVVHAICLAPEGPDAGTPFAHGWVEVNRQYVVQCGLIDGKREFYICRRRELYALLRVQLSTVYTLDEVWLKNRETNHVGPWEPAYRDLCSKDHKVFQEVVHGNSEASVDS